jgi:hypothetical protein
MEMEPLRAKVFISCGQQKDTEEVKVAHDIAKNLGELGFDHYIAVQEQTLRGLKENIFSQLKTSEYFLFIDFLREQFANSSEHRGSLFSHQELAIASFLNIKVIAFQQKGLKQLDGMLNSLQLNAIPFEKPEDLPKMVLAQVKTAGWRPNWKNALRITRTSSEYDETYLANLPNGPRARFFHLTVENLNPYDIARNCTAYVEVIKNLSTNSVIPFRTAELKWAGYMLPNAAIMPRMKRDLDAFYVLYDSPQIVHFQCFTDSGAFMRPIEGPGEFQLDYVVISENFPTAKIKTLLTISNSIDDLELAQID